MAQENHGFVDLILAAQIIRHLPVTGLDRAAAVLDNDLLIRNQLRNDRSDFQLTPTVGNDREFPLDIAHGGGQMLELLQLQMIHQFIHRIGVGADSPVHPLLTVETEDVQDILVTIVVLLDLRALVINAVNQIAQRIVDLVPEGAALDLQFFALYKDAGVQDGIGDQLPGALFIGRRLLLPSADDRLDRLRQQSNVPALDILADLHGVLDLFKVRILVREQEDRLVLRRFHHQNLIPAAVQIGGHREHPQLHRAGERADHGLVHHLVKGEVVILVIFIFLADVEISVDDVSNFLRYIRAVDHRLPDLAGDILLVIRQEGIGFTVAGNIVLAIQAVQGLLHLLPHVDLIRADFRDHECGDVVQIRFDLVIHIADQIQEL